MILRWLFLFVWRSVLHSFDWLAPRLVHLEFHQQLAIQIALGALFTLSVLGIVAYLAMRWIGWRSLVIFAITPGIWVILALYCNSPRLFWRGEGAAAQEGLLPAKRLR